MLEITPQQQAAIRALCREFHVTRLETFGSATRTDLNPERSDVDVLVEFAPGTDLGPWLTGFWDLKARLEAILARTFDLVMAKGLRNPLLILAIDRDRRLLYAA